MRFASRRTTHWSHRAAARQLFAVLLLACAWFEGRADGLYVICHPSVSLGAADLRDVFLGEKQFAGPVKLAPADNISAREAFLEKVLKMNDAKYRTTWTKKSFRDGINPPAVNGSDTETLQYVKHAPGACSYVTTAPGPGVAIVAKF